MVALVAGENEQAIEGERTLAALGANVPRFGLGLGTFGFPGFAPPETPAPSFIEVAVCFQLLFFLHYLAHLLFPKTVMSELCCCWQSVIWLGIMPRAKALIVNYATDAKK